MQTKYVAGAAMLGALLLGAMSYDRDLLPAMRERFMPESVLYEGNLNTAILNRGDWANFALKGKKFHGSVYGCHWSFALAVVQWTYAGLSNRNERIAGKDAAVAAWGNFVDVGTCVETGPVWYAVEDIRPTHGSFLHSYSPGLRHTVPGVAVIRIDGWGERLYIGVNIPIGNNAS